MEMCNVTFVNKYKNIKRYLADNSIQKSAQQDTQIQC